MNTGLESQIVGEAVVEESPVTITAQDDKSGVTDEMVAETVERIMLMRLETEKAVRPKEDLIPNLENIPLLEELQNAEADADTHEKGLAARQDQVPEDLTSNLENDEKVAETVARIMLKRQEAEKAARQEEDLIPNLENIPLLEELQSAQADADTHENTAPGIFNIGSFDELVSSVGDFAVKILSRGNSKDEEDMVDVTKLEDDFYDGGSSDTSSYPDDNSDIIDEYLDKLNESFESFETYVLNRVFDIIDPLPEEEESEIHDEEHSEHSASSSTDLSTSKDSDRHQQDGQTNHSFDSALLTTINESDANEDDISQDNYNATKHIMRTTNAFDASSCSHQEDDEQPTLELNQSYENIVPKDEIFPTSSPQTDLVSIKHIISGSLEIEVVSRIVDEDESNENYDPSVQMVA